MEYRAYGLQYILVQAVILNTKNEFNALQLEHTLIHKEESGPYEV
jgi:hypothetical protein